MGTASSSSAWFPPIAVTDGAHKPFQLASILNRTVSGPSSGSIRSVTTQRKTSLAFTNAESGGMDMHIAEAGAPGHRPTTSRASRQPELRHVVADLLDLFARLAGITHLDHALT